VGLKRGPLSLVRITKELREWQCSGSGSRKPRLTVLKLGKQPLLGKAFNNTEDLFSVKSGSRLYKNIQRYGRERTLCGGGVEYLHRDPGSRRRRRNGKSQNLRQ
jgi:hypothetical protein